MPAAQNITQAERPLAPLLMLSKIFVWPVLEMLMTWPAIASKYVAARTPRPKTLVIAVSSCTHHLPQMLYN